ncbi:hypothetical protein RJ641_031200, partial [Dillenia turbinata]
ICAGHELLIFSQRIIRTLQCDGKDAGDYLDPCDDIEHGGVDDMLLLRHLKCLKDGVNVDVQCCLISGQGKWNGKKQERKDEDMHGLRAFD